MYKYINFNNLRKKEKVYEWGCDGWVELTFVETQKTTKKIQKEGKENTKNNIFLEQ